MALQVFSEIGRLRRVLVHSPGLEIDLMVPGMMERLLFDDILDGGRARLEHGHFRTVLESAGVEVLDAADLLADVVQDPSVRGEVLEELGRGYGVDAEVIAQLRDLDSGRLASALITGLRSAPSTDPGDRLSLFDLVPVPNYFFQRDPQFVLGDRVVISGMATDARDRESLLAATIFRHHEKLGAGQSMIELQNLPHPQPAFGPVFTWPSIEGGDVLVASPEVVLVGISERTNRSGAEGLAEALRAAGTGFRHLLLVDMPARRSFMHLDTVFTFIDHGLCLAHAPLLSPSGMEQVRVYECDLTKELLTFTVAASFRRALADVGLEIDLVPCGGDDPIDQEREQWTDGANAFAIEPGVILLYERNHKTIEALERRGFREVTHRDVIDHGVEVLGHGRTVVTFAGHELSRARGGPRCMTMPLERDPIG